MYEVLLFLIISLYFCCPSLARVVFCNHSLNKMVLFTVDCQLLARCCFLCSTPSLNSTENLFPRKIYMTFCCQDIPTVYSFHIVSYLPFIAKSFIILLVLAHQINADLLNFILTSTYFNKSRYLLVVKCNLANENSSSNTSIQVFTFINFNFSFNSASWLKSRLWKYDQSTYRESGYS